MILQAKPLHDDDILSKLHPLTRSWFEKKYGSFTLPQRMSIPLIKEGKNVLISSPTGSGKTLSAFLGILDELVWSAVAGNLEDRVYAVYISPLRALNNDMNRNLLDPLQGISEEANRNGMQFQQIRVGVRTSDTSPTEKQRMLRKPPHILITTPESFAISLASVKFRETIKNIRWIVIDEIHELAGSKRGSYLMGSIEIFTKLLATREPSRVGLSATVSPLEEVAKFLVGNSRECHIADARFVKPADIKVISPVRDLVHSPEEEVNRGIYRTLIEEIKRYRTTLIFTNTRSAAERVSYKLKTLLKEDDTIGEDSIGAHHSSLGREVRLDIEERLKRGELKAVVSSTSLELGIDIGYIDVVILMSSPKSVSRLLQRIGRAGHHIRETSRGRIIVVDRDDLVECNVLADLARKRKIDNIHIPENPLDVAIQLVILATLVREVNKKELLEVLRGSYPYAKFTEEDYEAVLKYLTSESLSQHGTIYPKLRLENDVLRPKRGVRMIFFMNSGTIPDEAKVPAKLENGRVVGTLEEEFVENLTPGDIFILGGVPYEFLGSSGLFIKVRRAEGKRPTVPSWFSEMLPLAYDSALEIGRFRGYVKSLITQGNDEKNIEEIAKVYEISKSAARSIYEYFMEQYLFTEGKIPTDKNILIEIYDDEEEGNRNYIFHSLFGRRIVEALSKAVADVISSALNQDVGVSVSDNGFIIKVSGKPDYDIASVFNLLEPETLYERLSNVIMRTEMLKRRFRHCAERSFMLLRRYKGYETSLARRQINSQGLIGVVKEIDNFPVLKETVREILEDHMDIRHTREVLSKIRSGEITLSVIGPLTVPSPFSHNMLLREYSDVVLAEDKRNLMAELHKKVLDFLSEKGVTANLSYTETR